MTRAGRGFLSCLLLLAAGCDPAGPPPFPDRPGRPLPGLEEREAGRFLLGQAVFERLATEEEGLGPLFNAPRCSTCHDDPGSGGTSDIRVVKATRWDGERCDLLHEQGGDNIQQLATPLLTAHGLGPERIPPDANASASVTAPTLYGLGLVEAIPLATLRALADPEDRDGDGISGRLGTDASGQPGRFGRKGEVATLAGFVDTALRFELGFTTPDHPREEAVNGVPIPPDADPMGEPEIDRRGVDLLTEYVRYLGPPAPRRPAAGPDRDAIDAGEIIFRETGCAACHVPELETGAHAVPALSRVRVPLYSDLLLHDLGPGLSGVCGPGAAPTEHRTARLWGLGLRRAFLHDGRASSLPAAVEAHGGEGAASREAFRGLSEPDLRRLLLFLESL